MSQTYTSSKPVKGFKGEPLTVPASNGTKTVFNRRQGFDCITVDPAADMRLGLVPRIAGLWSRTGAGVWTNLLDQKDVNGLRVIDRGASAPVRAAFASTTKVYVGWVRKINDIYLDINGVNATASTLTLANSSSAGFVSLAVTADGSDSGGATFAIDGNITFTPPSTWTAQSLKEQLNDPNAPDAKLFWLELSFSASLDAGTTIDQLMGFIETDGAGTNTGDTAFLGAGAVRQIPLSEEVGAIQPIAQAASATTCNVDWERL